MQRAIGKLAVLACLTLLPAGCIEEELPSDPPAETPTSAMAAPVEARPVSPPPLPERSDVRLRAEALLARFVEALNSGDAGAVARLAAQVPEAPDPSAASAAIDDYRRFFGEGRVAEVRHVGESGDDPSTGSDVLFTYQIASEGGPAKHVEVRFDARLDTMRIWDEFLTYSWRVHGLVDLVIEALRRGDEAALASLWFDADPVTASAAGRAVAHYTERYELPTLQIAFVGLEPDRSLAAPVFLFEMRGERDGETLHHTLRIAANEDALAWDDPLVPRRGGI